MCCSTLKIGKILFILGIYLLQLGKNILFGFGNDTRNRSRLYSEKNLFVCLFVLMLYVPAVKKMGPSQKYKGH